MVRVIQGEGAPIPALKMEERDHDSRTTRSLQKLTRHRSPPTASRKECNHLDFSSMRPILCCFKSLNCGILLQQLEN